MPQIDTERLKQYADMVFKRSNYFNNYTLQTIGRRIKNIGKLSAADQTALKNMVDISGDMKAITKELANITKMNIDDIEKIYTQITTDGVNSYKPLFDFKEMDYVPFENNEFAQQLVKHWYDETVSTMLNLSRTKALYFDKYDVWGNVTGTMPLEGAFQKVVDDAVIAVSTGTTDFNTAMRETIKQLGGSGVRVNYGNSVTRRLDSMVRQNLLYGAKQSAQEYDEYIGEKLGCDGFAVDYHPNARPSHVFMGGEMFSYKGEVTIEGVIYHDGTEALKCLQDYGCLHFKENVILGVSQPRYDEKWLVEQKKKDSEKIYYDEERDKKYSEYLKENNITLSGNQLKDYQIMKSKGLDPPPPYYGIKKTRYGWKQEQRKIETAVREQRDIHTLAEAAGDNVLVKQSDPKMGLLKGRYNELCKNIGLQPTLERMATTKLQIADNVKPTFTGYSNAANAATRNTHTILEFNPKADFSVELTGYSDKINQGISKASYKVAELGGNTKREYLSLIDLETGNEMYFEEGNEFSVGNQDFWAFVEKNKGKNFAFIHNHNTDGYFSETDLRTLLFQKNIRIFGAIRIDGVKYFTEKTTTLTGSPYFDKMFENELKDLNNQSRRGIITGGERTKMREEIIVNKLIEKYTKGLIEIDGRN